MAKQTQADFDKGYKDAIDYFNEHIEMSKDVEVAYDDMCYEFMPIMFWAKHQWKVIYTKYHNGCVKAINEIYDKYIRKD